MCRESLLHIPPYTSFYSAGSTTYTDLPHPSPDSTTEGGRSEPSRSQRRRVAAASLIGTTIEWYDYFIFGSAAALVFGPLFFPRADPLTGTLAAFAAFAVGFIARPIGGIMMGHFRDRIGRKSMLITSMMLMGVSTVLIGLLPTYGTIGVAAPVLLVVLPWCRASVSAASRAGRC